MASTISDIDACNKKLEVSVPREKVAKEIDRAYSRLAGRVKLKGFRKGKVPRHILEQYYGEDVQAEVMNQVITVSYRELLEEKGMRPVGEPNVTDIAMEEGVSDLTYKATVEVIPPLELGEYKGIGIEVVSRPVSDDLVEEQIGQMLKRNASFEDVERAAAVGDYVLFDIEGFDGDEPVPDTRRENEGLIVGEGMNEKDLEDTLIGMKPGEEGDLELDMPEDGPPHLAGKNIRFHLKVHSVKEAYPPELDEEFVRSLGSGLSAVEEFRDQVRKELEAHEESTARQQGVSQLLEKLLEMHPFEVPSSLTAAEADEQIAGYERQARQENPDVQITQAQRDQMRQSILPQAEERVRQMILIDRVREREGIDASPGEVEAHIRTLAARYQMDPAKLRERMEMTGGMGSLLQNINYNKAVDWLYGQAKVDICEDDAGAGGEAPGAPEEDTQTSE
jgi:trigger factor